MSQTQIFIFMGMLALLALLFVIVGANRTRNAKREAPSGGGTVSSGDVGSSGKSKNLDSDGDGGDGGGDGGGGGD